MTISSKQRSFVFAAIATVFTMWAGYGRTLTASQGKAVCCTDGKCCGDKACSGECCKTGTCKAGCNSVKAEKSACCTAKTAAKAVCCTDGKCCGDKACNGDCCKAGTCKTGCNAAVKSVKSGCCDNNAATCAEDKACCSQKKRAKAA